MLLCSLRCCAERTPRFCMERALLARARGKAEEQARRCWTWIILGCVCCGSFRMMHCAVPYCRDENKRKEEKGFSFYMVGTLETSPDHKLLAWAEDTTGNERYTLHVKVRARGGPQIGLLPVA